MPVAERTSTTPNFMSSLHWLPSPNAASTTTRHGPARDQSWCTLLKGRQVTIHTDEIAKRSANSMPSFVPEWTCWDAEPLDTFAATLNHSSPLTAQTKTPYSPRAWRFQMSTDQLFRTVHIILLNHYIPKRRFPSKFFSIVPGIPRWHQLNTYWPSILKSNKGVRANPTLPLARPPHNVKSSQKYQIFHDWFRYHRC